MEAPFKTRITVCVCVFLFVPSLTQEQVMRSLTSTSALPPHKDVIHLPAETMMRLPFPLPQLYFGNMDSVSLALAANQLRGKKQNKKEKNKKRSST